ncbi:MAG: VCBS repeat-containing protein [Fimbriimonadaceae bacterium]|nr:VCBS repeat-containing protein [Fimbriimonadaceae bacterium]NUM39732.1 VCBS repeat-containing protein [Armatimonadota bacterium]
MLAYFCLAIGWVTPTASVFAPAVPWALNFAAPPRIPLVGDVNADGLADLICVYPEGDCIIDVSLNVEGQKPSFGFQARTGWGKNCQAAVSGDFDGDGKADVLGLFDGSELVLASDFGDRKFRSSAPWASLPKNVSSPDMSWLQAGEVLLVRSRGAEEGFTIRLKDRKVDRVRLPQCLWIAGPSEAPPGGNGAFRPGWLLELGGTLRYEGRELAKIESGPGDGKTYGAGQARRDRGKRLRFE